ncbi:MAG: hypothetical protein CMO54_11120 [Verrucomicrobiales bacterium]|nr:hypothetical protein [Verrucomicrobiales bacterium]
MFSLNRTIIISLLCLLACSCNPSDERVEITKTRELGKFAPKPILGLNFKERVGLQEAKQDNSQTSSVAFFVKLTGPKDTVDSEIENFNLFCNSIKIGEGNPPFTWVKPESWKDEKQSSMRVANFSFGPNSLGECYFTVLPGGGGGLLANVNRWRKQMSLNDLDLSEVNDLPDRQFLLGVGKFLELEGSFKSVGSTDIREGYKMIGIILPELQITGGK